MAYGYNQYIIYKYMGYSDNFKNLNNHAWLAGSAGKNTGCSSRGPRFNFQHQHGSSRLFITPLFITPGMHMGQYIHAGKAFKCIKIKIKK